MNKLLSVTGILAGALWLCTASAGVRTPFPLVISNAGKTASGALGTIRNDGTTTALTCTLRGCPSTAVCNNVPFPAVISVACQAIGAVTLECTSTNANLVAAVQAMSPDSWVSFTSDRTGSTGTCTTVVVSNGSIYEVPSAYP